MHKVYYLLYRWHIIYCTGGILSTVQAAYYLLYRWHIIYRAVGTLPQVEMIRYQLSLGYITAGFDGRSI